MAKEMMFVLTGKPGSKLLMSNGRMADPLNPYAQRLKTATKGGFSNKTIEQQAEIGVLQWEGALYYDEEIGPYVPAENIEAVLRDGAKVKKLGKAMTQGTALLQEKVPLSHSGPDDYEAMKKSCLLRATVKQGMNRIPRVRPAFSDWSLEFSLLVDEQKVEFDQVLAAFKEAGTYLGLGDWRPRYGRFDVECVS